MGSTGVFGHLDELVREYLLFRGFSATLKAFEADLRQEREKGFRVDRLLDHLLSHVSNHDLSGLRELWSHLNQRLFCRLEQPQLGAVAKLESSLLKLYAVNCVQTKRPDKLRDFFDKMAPELQSLPDWKDWFALPFLPGPESNPLFAGYFARQWQDTLVLSLFNFLALTFACLPAPRLAEFHAQAAKTRRLRDENDAMRQKLSALSNLVRMRRGGGDQDPPELHVPGAFPPDDIMDDFCIIAQEAPAADSQVKTLKNFLRNFTGGGSASSSAPTASAAGAERRSAVKASGPPAASSSSASSAAKATKSRSSSKPRPSLAGQATTEGASGGGAVTKPKHAPVKRLSQTSLNLSATSSLSASPSPSKSSASARASQQPPSSSSPANLSQRRPQESSKLAYLLLGQEEYREHHSEVTHCKFSSSGYVIASSDVSGVIKIWSSTPAPQTLATFVCQSAVTALEWLPGSERHFLYGTQSGLVRLGDKNERRASKEPLLKESGGSGGGGGGGGGGVRAIACSPNGSLCAVAARGGAAETLQLFQLKTMQQECDLGARLPLAEITGCAFNHNSQMLVASGRDGKVRIFDLRRNDCISSWSAGGDDGGGGDAIVSLALSSDETTVHTLSESGYFSSWSLFQSGQRSFGCRLADDDPYFTAGLYPRHAWGRLFSFSGDEKHLLTCSVNGGVIYEFGSAAATKLNKVLGLKGHQAHTTCTDWSVANDCGPCITAAMDGQITVSTLLNQ